MSYLVFVCLLIKKDYDDNYKDVSRFGSWKYLVVHSFGPGSLDRTSDRPWTVGHDDVIEAAIGQWGRSANAEWYV